MLHQRDTNASSYIQRLAKSFLPYQENLNTIPQELEQQQNVRENSASRANGHRFCITFWNPLIIILKKKQPKMFWMPSK